MRLIATNLDMPFNASEASLNLLLSSHLRVPVDEITGVRILRRSIDARDKADIRCIYNVAFEVASETAKRIASLELNNVGRFSEHVKHDTPSGSIPQPAPIVIVGFGPAGIFAALELAERGYKIIVLERGNPIETRKADVEDFFANGKLNPNSNIMFGEGGAGTFSDGKLTTRIKDERAFDVVNTLVRFGADARIAVEAKPHIGTDALSTVILNMRKRLEELGADIRFGACVTDFTQNKGRIDSVTVNESERIACCAAIFAVGQAARDTYRLLLKKGAELAPKPFAVGVRIEHPQEFIDKTQYGKFAGHPRLGAAEYRLTGKSGSRGVYTFCMCPGGYVVASSSDNNQVVTNGMSYNSRGGVNGNSAIVVQVNPSDFGPDPLSGVLFQEKLEHAAFRLGGGNYCAPAMRVGDFMERNKPLAFGSVKPSYRPGAVPKDIRRCLPPVIASGIEAGIRAFNNQMKGFNMYDAVLTAVESRTSAPVRILRDENGEATRLKGLYPVGEGAGYAGGIVSAAVDGIKAAERVIGIYRPL